MSMTEFGIVTITMIWGIIEVIGPAEAADIMAEGMADPEEDAVKDRGL